MLSIILAVISGGLMVLCQPPFNMGHLCWFALIPLFIALEGKTLKRSFLLGLLFGAVYFTGLLYWVFPILMPQTVFGGIILIFYMSLYFAVFCLLFQYCIKPVIPLLFHESKKGDSLYAASSEQSATQIGGHKTDAVSPLKYVLFASVLWVSLEYIRTLGPLGFPWGLFAYAQWKNVTLIQMVDITGVYGVSFIIMLFNAALAYIIMQYRKPSLSNTLGTPQMSVLSIILVSAIIFVFYYGMNAIGKYSLTVENKRGGIDVAIIQGNIDQNEKWDEHYLGKTLGVFYGLTRELRTSPDLVIWPETAITLSLNENPVVRDNILGFVKSTGSSLITGVLESENNKYYNRAVFISRQGEIAGKYDKIHLVPFVEAVPKFFYVIMPFLKQAVPGEDFTPGETFAVFSGPKGNFSCCVCFESIFPGHIRRFAKDGASFLVNITNDAWFGKTSAPYHHFAINVFRAVENRMEIARAANSGISGFIDKTGTPAYYTKLYTRGIIRSYLTPRTNITFYTRFGDVFAFACLIASLLFIIKLPVTRKVK